MQMRIEGGVFTGTQQIDDKKQRSTYSRKRVLGRQSFKITNRSLLCLPRRLPEIFHVTPKQFRNQNKQIVIWNFKQRKVVKVKDAVYYHLWQRSPFRRLNLAEISTGWRQDLTKMNELFVFLCDFHALVRESFGEEFPWHAGNGGE